MSAIFVVKDFRELGFWRDILEHILVKRKMELTSFDNINFLDKGLFQIGVKSKFREGI